MFCDREEAADALPERIDLLRKLVTVGWRQIPFDVEEQIVESFLQKSALFWCLRRGNLDLVIIQRLKRKNPLRIKTPRQPTELTCSLAKIKLKMGRDNDQWLFDSL